MWAVIVITDWCFVIAFALNVTNYENSLGLSVFAAVQMKRVPCRKAP